MVKSRGGHVVIRLPPVDRRGVGEERFYPYWSGWPRPYLFIDITLGSGESSLSPRSETRVHRVGRGRISLNRESILSLVGQGGACAPRRVGIGPMPIRLGEAELHCPGSSEGELDSTKAERGETHARKVGRGRTP